MYVVSLYCFVQKSTKVSGFGGVYSVESSQLRRQLHVTNFDMVAKLTESC